MVSRGTKSVDGSRPSLTQVARAAGVSVGTVSHVLNHPGRVRESTRRRVEEAIGELGFVRNTNASSLAGMDSRTVGFVAFDIGNSFFVDIARGAQEKARGEGMVLHVGHSDNDVSLQDRHIEAFSSARATGILLAPMTDPTDALAGIRRAGTPAVLLNYDWEGPDHCSVLVDNVQVGYTAARHMIELGRTRLAFVAGHHDAQPVRDRRDGVMRAVAEAERVTVVEVAVSDLEMEAGLEAGRRVAGAPEGSRPDGVIAVTDMLGAAIIQSLRDAGLSVPGDVAVMGCDHNVNAWGGSMPLTSVKLHGAAMGSAAIELLLDELKGVEHAHRRVVIEPTLVVRQSTGG